jgi:zinc transport system ATP-binding protein
MSGTETPVICFEGVEFAYGAHPAVEDADFDIFKGESVCVVGPNGGGKSTLIKLVLGLLEPRAGRVLLFGKDPKQSRGRVGYVPQYIEFDPLFPVSALEVCLMGCLRAGSLGWSSRSERQRALGILESLGLSAVAKAPFSSLSGGQRQAVLIARALVAEPELLLLDEPTAHVDLAAEARLHESIQSLGKDLTVLTVSHDLAFVSKAVPKVICVNRCVHMHPTVELTGERLTELYGYELRTVQHDHEHLDSHGGHCHG